MKRVLTLFILALVALSSCKKEEEPPVPAIVPKADLALVSSAADSITLKLTTEYIKEAAYICAPAATAEEGTPESIFEKGTSFVTADGENIFTIKDLLPNNEYKIMVAAKTVEDKFFEGKLELVATTEKRIAKAELALVEAASDSVTLKFTTEAIKECAYICEPAETAEGGTPEYIFEEGTVIETADGENIFSVKGLLPVSNYKITMAAKTVYDEFFEGKIELDVTTGDYSKFVTVLDQKYDGYTVHLNLPESITENDSLAIRYTIATLPMYNMMKMFYQTADADMLLQNAQQCTRESKDLIIDEEHRTEEDPEYGDLVEYWTPISPNEPTVFLAGEFSLGESDYGWGEGYYIPKFDYDGYYNALAETGEANESDFWTGLYHKETIFSRAPELLDSKLNVETVELTPAKARIAFRPEEGVQQYVVMLLDPDMYDLSMMLLDNNPDYLQWYTTSYFAFMQNFAISFEEEVEIDLTEFFYGLTPGTTIKMFAVGLGDEYGSLQNFQTKDITIPDYTKPAPVVTVTAIDNPEGTESPYEVWFNVKAQNADLESAKYVANYTREFEAMFSRGYDMQGLIEDMGNQLAEEDIAAINSPEGFNIKFSSRADSETMLGVIGYNDEGLGSEVASAKNSTIPVPAQDPVDSPLFTELKGDWTASATLAKYDKETEGWIPDETPVTFKVHIDNALEEFPEALTDDIYALYPDQSKEEVDAMYQELLNRRELYNTRLKEQNSLVCTGFGIDPILEYQSPYDLFISKTYSGYDIETLFYDFGPKWNIRISSDGTVSIPVNINFLDPLANWHSTYGRKDICYLVPTGETTFIGGPADPNEEWPKIPVTVSEDKDTITLNSFTDENNDGEEEVYYPNVMTIGYYGFTTLKCGKIVSEITLTRGWTDPDATNVNATRNSYALPMKPANNFVYKPATVTTSRTGFSKLSKPIKKVNGPKRVSTDEFKARMNSICTKLLGKR